MTPELERQLGMDFPAAFRALARRTLYEVDEMITSMNRGELKRVPHIQTFGVEHGDGWYGLLREIGEKLEPWCVETGAFAWQVKEKYGGLRFYLSGNETPDILAIVDEAETRSETICEMCGAPGIVREHNDWLSTRCDRCDDPGKRFISGVENIEAILKYAIRPNTPEEAAKWRHMLSRLPKI